MLHFLESVTAGMETARELAVPLISSMAELIGLLIIVVSLVKTTYHYVRVMVFHDNFDYHLEMSAGLVTALEFLMAAEVAKTILLPTLDTVLLLVATFVSRALMNILLRMEMHSARIEHAGPPPAPGKGFAWPWQHRQKPEDKPQEARSQGDEPPEDQG